MSGDNDTIFGNNLTTTPFDSLPVVALLSEPPPTQPPHIYRFTRADFVTADRGSIRLSPGLRALLIAMIVAVIGAAISYVLYSARRSTSVVAPTSGKVTEELQVTEDEEMGGGEETSSMDAGGAIAAAADKACGTAKSAGEDEEKDLDIET